MPWLAIRRFHFWQLSAGHHTSDRGSDFALVEILWSVGRSVKVKKKLLGELMETLSQAGIDSENVMVFFKETAWENWWFGGGRLIHAP